MRQQWHIENHLKLSFVCAFGWHSCTHTYTQTTPKTLCANSIKQTAISAMDK